MAKALNYEPHSHFDTIYFFHPQFWLSYCKKFSISPCYRSRRHINSCDFMAENQFVARLHAPPSQLTSRLPEQLQPTELQIGSNDYDVRPRESGIPTLRPRSSHEIRSTLSPSPLFIEPTKRSKDDSSLAHGPVTPKRPFPQRGLSLQMPPRDVSSTSTANLTKRVSLSPKVDSSVTYATPSSVLPRRSRGMDFSRACTNLHHSTLAEQPSPDSSPTIGGRGLMIPRKGLFNPLNTSNIPDSPGSIPNSFWSTLPTTDRSAISSSVGSMNMMDCDSGSTSSDGDDLMGHADDDYTIHMTPQTSKVGNGALSSYGSAIVSSPGGDGVGGNSPAAAKIMSFQRARFNSKGRSRRNSSASGKSSIHGQEPPSPLLKSIEKFSGGGLLGKDHSKLDMNSRRQSLSLGTNDLRLSDCEESDEGTNGRSSPNEYSGISVPLTPTMDERKNVIRRAVTRRGNLLVRVNFSIFRGTSFPCLVFIY